jgi:hypothetical protein
MKLFNNLRDIFRLEGKLPDDLNPNNSKPSPNGTPPSCGQNETLFDKNERIMQKKVAALTDNLKKKYENTRTSPDLKRAVKRIVDHLDKHGPFLWGHLLQVQTAHGIVTRLIDRTNNILECFFRKMKHGERRRSGRKKLTKDFENIPPAAALAMNLTDPDYIKIVCGSLENLPRCFSEIDQEKWHESLNREKRADTNNGDGMADPVFCDHVLLPRDVKSFVRRKTLSDWVLHASENIPFPSANGSSEKVSHSDQLPFWDMENFLCDTI